MKRIEIRYGGDSYSVGGRELEDLLDQIAEAIASDGAWLEVNDGEGQERPALIRIGPGVPVAVIPIPGPDD